MKYSLMSLMIDQEIKITKPSFIHKMILHDLGYEGEVQDIGEMFQFLQSHGIPMKNGTMTFRDYVRFAKESGFDGIDVMAFHFEEDGESAGKILEEYGITFSAIDIIVEFGNAVTEEMYRQKLSEVKQVMDRAYTAGCRTALVVPTQGIPAPGITREQVFQNMVRGMKASVAYGNEIGMAVNIETLESIAVPLCSIGEMQRLFDAVPGLKYNHDSGNPVIMMEDPVEMYRRFSGLVNNVHFKDFKYADRQTRYIDPMGRHLELANSGDGIVDFREHLKVLKQDGYQGYIAIEGVIPAEDPLKGAAGALEYFKKLEEEVC